MGCERTSRHIVTALGQDITILSRRGATDLMFERECDLIFFFQAEDGIRDLTVTGVQTCALPISAPRRAGAAGRSRRAPASRPPAPRAAASRAARDRHRAGGRSRRTAAPARDEA